jgi:predicted DNA-binding protein (UPF0251 family)
MCEAFVEDDIDEICAFLREKVWKAIEAFDSSRVRKTSKYTPDEQLERFVNSCVQNGKKDVLKKKRRGWLFIEDMVVQGADDSNKLHDSFENRYLREDDTFARFEPDPDMPIIPSILNDEEGEVARMLYLEFKVDEIAAELGTTRKGVAQIVESIRVKLAPAPVHPDAPRLALAA